MNTREARRICAEHCPQRGIPSHRLFTKLRQQLSESGSFAPRAPDRGRPRSVRTPDVDVGLLRRTEEDSGTGVRRISAAEVIGVPLV
jgi:hypothetical protein